MNGPRTIAVVNRKGGVAKTTTAVAIGELLARTVGPATVLDLDPQGSAATWADLAEAAGDPLAVTIIQPEETNPVRLPRWVRQNFDSDHLLIIDCPPGDAEGTHAAAIEVAADREGLVLIPSSPDLADTIATATTWNDVNGRAAAAVLLTKVESETIRQREARQELTESVDPEDPEAEAVEALVLDVEIPKRQEIARTGMQPIGERSLLLNAYQPVVDELEERWTE